MSWFGWKIPQWKRKNSELVPQKTTNNVLSIGPNDFTLRDPNTTVLNQHNSYIDATGEIGIGYNFHLPNGAKITSIIIYGNTSFEDRTLQIRRLNLTNTQQDYLTPDFHANTAQTTITYPTVDNNTYAYQFGFTMQNGDAVYGAKINYDFGG